MKVEDVLGGRKRTKVRGQRQPRAKHVELVTEGGALPDVGPIHIDEIEPTLTAIEQELGIDLKNNVLGSVGKKTFSGDIDVAINLSKDEIPAFMQKLEKSKVLDHVAKTTIIMTRARIINYDESKQAPGRTGYVQVDFMPGDPDWMKVFYHAPQEGTSKYKGAYRNILLGILSKHFDAIESPEKIKDGRPMSIKRYMFSPRDGLVYIERRPVQKKDSTGYLKKNKNEIIDGPWRTRNDIAAQLELGTAEDLESFETVLSAIEQNHEPKLLAKISAEFAKDDLVQKVGMPPELEKYV